MVNHQSQLTNRWPLGAGQDKEADSPQSLQAEHSLISADFSLEKPTGTPDPRNTIAGVCSFTPSVCGDLSQHQPETCLLSELWDTPGSTLIPDMLSSFTPHTSEADTVCYPYVTLEESEAW